MTQQEHGWLGRRARAASRIAVVRRGWIQYFGVVDAMLPRKCNARRRGLGRVDECPEDWRSDAVDGVFVWLPVTPHAPHVRPIRSDRSGNVAHGAGCAGCGLCGSGRWGTRALVLRGTALVLLMLLIRRCIPPRLPRLSTFGFLGFRDQHDSQQGAGVVLAASEASSG